MVGFFAVTIYSVFTVFASRFRFFFNKLELMKKSLVKFDIINPKELEKVV